VGREAARHGSGVRRPARTWGGRGWPEVGDGPDRWAPPVGGCVREREGSGAYGPAGEMGRRGFVGLGGRKEKRSGPREKKKEERRMGRG
jgi:hypothetical protein